MTLLRCQSKRKTGFPVIICRALPSLSTENHFPLQLALELRGRSLTMFFQNLLEIQNKPQHSSFKYFDLILVIIKKPGHIYNVVLLEIPFLYQNVQIETIFEVIRGEC